MCAAEGGVAVERGSEVSNPHMSRAVPGLESCRQMDSEMPRGWSRRGWNLSEPFVSGGN